LRQAPGFWDWLSFSPAHGKKFVTDNQWGLIVRQNRNRFINKNRTQVVREGHERKYGILCGFWHPDEEMHLEGKDLILYLRGKKQFLPTQESAL
jgi:hypothetical protein